MALTRLTLLNLPEGTTVKIGNTTNTAGVEGTVTFQLAIGAYTAVVTYAGQTVNVSLHVPESVQDQVDTAVSTATQGLKTQAELDTAVATAVSTATQGLKTQAELDTAVATAKDEALNASGYVDTTEVNIDTNTIKVTIPTKTKNNAVKYKIYNSVAIGGDSGTLTIPTNRRIDIYFNDVSKVELIAGNNKILETIDMDFSVVANIATNAGTSKQGYINIVNAIKDGATKSIYFEVNTPTEIGATYTEWGKVYAVYEGNGNTLFDLILTSPTNSYTLPMNPNPDTVYTGLKVTDADGKTLDYIDTYFDIIDNTPTVSLTASSYTLEYLATGKANLKPIDPIIKKYEVVTPNGLGNAGMQVVDALDRTDGIQISRDSTKTKEVTLFGVADKFLAKFYIDKQASTPSYSIDSPYLSRTKLQGTLKPDGVNANVRVYLHQVGSTTAHDNKITGATGYFELSANLGVANGEQFTVGFNADGTNPLITATRNGAVINHG